MASYWPTEDAKRNDPAITEIMNRLPKIVFSNTLKKVEWENTRLVNENFVEAISKLKQEAGKDIAIFGSSDLAVTLLEHGLLDELRIMVNPILLGKGKTIFQGIKTQLGLKLLKTRTFKSGNILLYYEPEYK